MRVMTLSSVWSRSAVTAVCAAVALSAAPAGGQTQPAAGQQPTTTQQPATPQQPAAAAAPDPGRKFTGQAGILFNIIKPEKTADFEKFLGRVGEALQKSTNPARQKQAAGWKVYKAAEPDPRGNIMYLYVVDPVAPGEDYTVTRIIAEAFPSEAQAIYETIKDAFAGQSIVNLQLVQDYTKLVSVTPMAPPTTGTTTPPPPAAPKPPQQ